MLLPLPLKGLTARNQSIGSPLEAIPVTATPLHSVGSEAAPASHAIKLPHRPSTDGQTHGGLAQVDYKFLQPHSNKVAVGPFE